MTQLSITTAVNTIELVSSGDAITLTLTAIPIEIPIEVNYGTTNHANLINKDFANSGHTGFMPEAPDDDKLYGRKNEAFEEIVIPTKTSELTNDSGFITESEADSFYYPINAASAVYSTLLNGVDAAGNTLKKLYDFILALFPQTNKTFTGAVDLTKVDTHYNNFTQSGALGITIAANPIIGGGAEVQITADGNAITVTGAILYGDTDFVTTAGIKNHVMFYYFTTGIKYTVKQIS